MVVVVAAAAVVVVAVVVVVVVVFIALMLHFRCPLVQICALGLLFISSMPESYLSCPKATNWPFSCSTWDFSW